MLHFVPFFFHLIGLSPFALRPLLMASWVFLVIGFPLRLDLDVDFFEVEADRFLGALPSLTSSP